MFFKKIPRALLQRLAQQKAQPKTAEAPKRSSTANKIKGAIAGAMTGSLKNPIKADPTKAIAKVAKKLFRFEDGGSVQKRPVSTKRGKPPGARRITPTFTDKNPAPGRVSSPQKATPTTPQQRSAPPMKTGMPPKGVRKFQGGGAVYEVNGQRVTKEQYEETGKKMDKRYEEAGREMDTPKSKVEEEMMDFAKAAKERAKQRAQSKTTPVNKAKGGEAKKPGLYANIHAKRKRIAAGSNEKMRKVGAKGAPSKADFIKSAKTAKRGR